MSLSIIYLRLGFKVSTVNTEHSLFCTYTRVHSTLESGLSSLNFFMPFANGPKSFKRPIFEIFVRSYFRTERFIRYIRYFHLFFKVIPLVNNLNLINDINGRYFKNL